MNEAFIAFGSALFGSLCGYCFAMRSTRYTEQVAVLTDFKRRLVKHIDRIDAARGSGNSALGEIQTCMKDMKTEYLLCRTALSKRSARRFAQAWKKFYREDDGSDLLEYWETGPEDVEPKRSKAIARLHDILSLQIRTWE